MVEVTVQLSSPMSKSIREIANKQFEGNLPAVLNAALELYLDTQARKRELLKKNSSRSGSVWWHRRRRFRTPHTRVSRCKILETSIKS